MTGYLCSPDAASTWGRIFSAFKWRRCKGVMGYEGTEYGGSHIPPGQSSGVETEARILILGTTGALTRLEEEGGSKEAAVAYTRRRLRSQRVWDVLKRYDMDRGRAEHLWECVKNWLHVALGDDVYALEELELPWDSQIGTEGLTSVV